MRLLVVGCGVSGLRHVHTAAALPPDRALTCLAWDPDASARDAATAAGARAFETLAAALAEKPEAVLICAPAESHVELAQLALDAGAHVYVEHPLAPTLDGVEGLVLAAEAAGRPLFVGYDLRFQPGISTLVSRVRAGELGRLRSLRAELGGTAPGPLGVVFDHTDTLELTLALAGDFCRGACLSQRNGEIDLRQPDMAALVLHTDDGIMVDLYLDSLARPATQRVQVIGERGTLTWDHRDGLHHLDHTSGVTSVSPLATDAPAPAVARLTCFLDCVAGRAQPPVDGRAAMRVVDIARCLVWACGDRREVDLH